RRGAARHVEPDRLDRGPFAAEFDTERVGVALVLRLLPFVIGGDALAGELEGIEGRGVAGVLRRGDLGRGDAQADFVEIDAIVFLRQFDQGAVAARRHVGNDRAHACFDVGGRLALDIEQGGKTRGEIGALAVEALRHRPDPAGMTRVDRSMGDAPRPVNPRPRRQAKGPAARRSLVANGRSTAISSAWPRTFSASPRISSAWPSTSPFCGAWAGDASCDASP